MNEVLLQNEEATKIFIKNFYDFVVFVPRRGRAMEIHDKEKPK